MNWQIDEHETLWFRKGDINITRKHNLIVLMRIRNEELVLKDTLDHISEFADYICVYDDCSDDNTREILKSHPSVFLIVENNLWRKGTDNRLLSETRHRGLLLELANRYLSFKWCMCCDADERYIGDIKSYVEQDVAEKPEGVRIQLFDAYMTAGNDEPFRQDLKMMDFRKYFGPECRNILMLWQNKSHIVYKGLDAREPSCVTTEIVKFYCQHYGKSLSYEHWEETCNYYVENFPWDPYGKKWSARKGKALHSQSDFGRPLLPWGQELFANATTEF
ncbi:glycosyltransferase family 2 protein [Pantoea anthophila]|nr:glycosyltransferase family 2 protein [Pantoea anthophila]